MGNFAENLNLGNRVRPPLKIWIFFHLFVALLQKAHFLKGIRQKSFQFEKNQKFSQKF